LVILIYVNNGEFFHPRVQVRIHEMLNHDHIVTVLSHHSVDDRHALVLELCENGSVRQLLSKTAGGLLTEPVCRRYFRQMHSAVVYLHSRSIVHRDIRTDNFLIDSYDRIKLIDFGSALHFATGDPLFTSRQVRAYLRPYLNTDAACWALQGLISVTEVTGGYSCPGIDLCLPARRW
jgi:serine/threonine protein kinase